MKLSRTSKRILAMIVIPISLIIVSLLIAVIIIHTKWMFVLFAALVFGYILWMLTDELID